MNEAIVKKIKSITPSKGFCVKTKTEREQICNYARRLKERGEIKFSVVTKEEKDGTFSVGAL